MFNRISNVRNTCSSCRLRSNQVWRSERPVFHAVDRHQRRQQSAVALQVDDDNVTSKSAIDTKNESSTQSQESLTRLRDRDNLENSGKQHNQKNYRRWRPHPAAKLGVDVLGRPAEVLILPTRKRRVARVVPSEEEDATRSGLQTSLDSESRPISTKEVLRNLDSLKEDLGKGKDLFTMGEWNEYKTRLADGFTRIQLEEYLRTADGGKLKETSEKPWLVRGSVKRNIADQIMTTLWQWKHTDMQEATRDPVQDLTSKLATKNISVNAVKLGYIMLHEKQRLGRLSETLGVQIDVFKKKQKIRLTGATQALDNTIPQLKKLVNSIREQVVEIPTQLRKPLEEGTKSTAALTMLMRKHKLFISKDKDQLNVVGLAKTGADIVLRDLMLISGVLQTATPSTFFVEHKNEELIRIPFYDEHILSSSFRDQARFRYMSKSLRNHIGSDEIRAGGRSVRRLAEKLLRLANPDQGKLSQYVIGAGLLIHEYTASLGQALFDRRPAEENDNTPPPLESTVTSSNMVLRQALLPQVLARGDFARIGSSTPRTGTTEAAQPFLLSIRLRPAEQNAGYPLLEILLSGRDASLGLAQKMTVRQAFAVVDQWQHNVLLPDKTLDICLTRQSKIDLLGDPDTTLPKRDLRILQQLSSHLGQAESLDQHHLPPIWRIDLSTLMKKPQSTPNINDARLQLSLAGGQRSDKRDQNTMKDSVTTDRTAVYILEPVEALDVASFNFEQAGDDIFIDHIACHTELIDSPRQRQILRIASAPLCGVTEEDRGKLQAQPSSRAEWQKWLKRSVVVAYDLATMLHNTENSVGKQPDVTHSSETVL